MSRDINDLHPKVRDTLILALQELPNDSYYIDKTRVTQLQQYAYYLQGRASLYITNLARQEAHLQPISETENKRVITQLNGTVKELGGTGISLHQLGMAVDIIPKINGVAKWYSATNPAWEQIATVMKKHGFECGRDWEYFPDYPHYQLIPRGLIVSGGYINGEGINSLRSRDLSLC